MIRGLFVYDGPIRSGTAIETETDGIVKKVYAQTAALNLGDDNNVRLWVPKQPNRSVLNRIMGRLPFFPISTKWFDEVNVFTDIDYIYVRKSNIDLYFVRWLRRIRGVNPGIAIALEVPTFPYDAEYNTLSKKIALLKERFWRRRLAGLVDRVVTFSNDDEIWGLKTIIIQNGVDLSAAPVRKPANRSGSKVTLLAVATFSFWHGYDRLIRGLKDYYDANPTNEAQCDVSLLMVGQGTEEEGYRVLTKELGLSEKIRFLGPKYGNDLNDIFNQADVAIASLGIHRLGIDSVNTLKAREYCSRGIPFVIGYRDKGIEMLDQVLTVDSDESNVDVESIVEFLRRLNTKESSQDSARKMRKFAEDNLSWTKQMDVMRSQLLKESRNA